MGTLVIHAELPCLALLVLVKLLRLAVLVWLPSLGHRRLCRLGPAPCRLRCSMWWLALPSVLHGLVLARLYRLSRLNLQMPRLAILCKWWLTLLKMWGWC